MKRLVYILTIVAMLAGAPAVSAYDMLPEAEVTAVVEVRSTGVDVANNGNDAIEVVVYAVTGRSVCQGTVAPGAVEHYDLPCGYYIVKAGASPAVRVLIK